MTLRHGSVIGDQPGRLPAQKIAKRIDRSVKTQARPFRSGRFAFMGPNADGLKQRARKSTS